MAACTIFTHLSDLSAIPEKLRDLYGPEAVKVEGPEENWTGIELRRRKFLRRITLQFNALRGGLQLEEMKRGMRHVYSTVPAEDEEIRAKLLLRIQQFQCAIGVVSDGKMAGFEEAIFEACGAVNGLVFWEGNQMLNAKGHLVMNFKGKSRVGDLEVEAEVEEKVASEEALERKMETEEWLKEMNVPMNAFLPAIEDAAGANVRSKEEVVWRALSLALVALKGEGLEQVMLKQIYERFELAGRLSPMEQEFYEAEEPEEQSRINFAWRYEALFVMLWALGHADELGYPGGVCDVPAVVELIRKSGGHAGLVERSELRSDKELLDEADRIYRLHWAVVDARLRGEDAPADLEAGVVFERHYALNWLIGYQGADWDDVSTDT